MSGVAAEQLAFTAHQLRSPLSIIRGYADFILDRKRKKTAEELTSAASKIKATVDRAIKTIDTLLDFHLLYAGRMAYHPEQVALNDFIKGRMEEYERAVSEKNLSFDFRPAPEKIMVFADPLHLHHVFDNLFDNALKYTKKGAIRICTEVSPRKNSAVFSVTDSGKGIPAELLESIFLPFDRGSGHTTDVKGVGLGLAIVRKLVEINGGKVWAASRGEGKGATFFVMLPIKPQELSTSARHNRMVPSNRI